MRNLLVAIAMSSLANTAIAADLVSAPVETAATVATAYNWTGFYVGANAGYGWTSGNGKYSCFDPSGTQSGPTCQMLPPGADPIASGNGGLIGAQLGYNWQYDRWVLGAEADIDATSIKGSHTINGPFPFADPGLGLATPAGIYRPEAEINWLGTARLRAGYTITDRVLLYVTGGLAYGGAKANTLYTTPNTGGTYVGSESETKVGWTLGGGAEYAFADNWSVKLEGLYYDLGKIEAIGQETPIQFAPVGYRHNSQFDLNGGIVRLGVNYKF